MEASPMFPRLIASLSDSVFYLDASKMYSSSIGAAAAKFKQSEVSFILESFKKKHAEVLEPVFLRGSDLFSADSSVVRENDKTSGESDKKSILCSHFCSESTLAAGNYFAEVKIH